MPEKSENRETRNETTVRVIVPITYPLLELQDFRRGIRDGLFVPLNLTLRKF